MSPEDVRAGYSSCELRLTLRTLNFGSLGHLYHPGCTDDGGDPAIGLMRSFRWPAMVGGAVVAVDLVERQLKNEPGARRPKG